MIKIKNAGNAGPEFSSIEVSQRLDATNQRGINICATNSRDVIINIIIDRTSALHLADEIIRKLRTEAETPTVFHTGTL